MMGEGRLTEQGSNKTADFTQSLIVLTSNALHDEIGMLLDQFDDALELGNAVRAVLKDAKVFRPEIISRFDQLYVFRPLEGIVNAEIAALKIAGAASEYGLEIEHIDPAIVFEIMELGDAAQDTRELARVVDAKLGALLLQAREAGCERARIELGENGQPILQPALEVAG